MKSERTGELDGAAGGPEQMTGGLECMDERIDKVGCKTIELLIFIEDEGDNKAEETKEWLREEAFEDSIVDVVREGPSADEKAETDAEGYPTGLVKVLPGLIIVDDECNGQTFRCL